MFNKDSYTKQSGARRNGSDLQQFALVQQHRPRLAGSARRRAAADDKNCTELAQNLGKVQAGL
jgi:hypothetical protein